MCSNRKILWIATLITILYGCSPGEKSKLDDGLGDLVPAATRADAWIAPSYWTSTPIAAIKQVSNYSDLSQSFHIQHKQFVQVYAVGELLYNLSDYDKRYYLLNDDIELYFSSPSKGIRKQYIYNYLNSSSLEQVGVLAKELKPADKKSIYNTLLHYTELQIPLVNVGRYLSSDTVLKFDVAIGDNDDGFMQKSKLAWYATTAELGTARSAYGILLLNKRRVMPTVGPDTLISSFASPRIDGQLDSLWGRLPTYTIRHNVYGFNKDRDDLSAQVKTCWDSDNVYFLVEVRDSRKKYITQKKMSERELLVDYGWLEDKQGRIIWRMKTKTSKAAGGALKNQKADTLLLLEPGDYTLRYISDESHSNKQWDSPAPQTPFYGIIVYSAN